MATKKAAKPAKAAAKSKTRKVERKAVPTKPVARTSSAKKSVTPKRTTATKAKSATKKSAQRPSPAPDQAAAGGGSAVKPVSRPSPVSRPTMGNGVVATGVVTSPASAAARHNMAVQNQDFDDGDDNGSLLAGPRNVQPYIAKRGEQYMSTEQVNHFQTILTSWKRDLMVEVDRTVSHMKDEAANFPDPNDRATQEEEFSLELRTRDRERKLIRKIDEALKRIDDGSYGYCLETGEEIGVKRLEARPVATLSIEAQERRERRERQYGDRDDRYR